MLAPTHIEGVCGSMTNKASLGNKLVAKLSTYRHESGIMPEEA